MNYQKEDWNRQKEWERERNYKQHVQRIKSISSPKGRKRSKKQFIKHAQSRPQIANGRNYFRVEEVRKIDLENDRLLKKLTEIGRRKNKFAKQNSKQWNYFTINMRHQELKRKFREEELQQQNDMLIERIIRMRSKGSLNGSSLQATEQKQMKKVKRKRSSSFIFPKIKTSFGHTPQNAQN